MSGTGPPLPHVITFRYWTAVGVYILSIILCSTSTGLISSALKSSGSWSDIQSNVTGYTIAMGIGAASMVVGTVLFMFEYIEYSYILFAIMTGFAVGLTTTALAVATASR